jgi:hypothetical protein
MGLLDEIPGEYVDRLDAGNSMIIPLDEATRLEVGKDRVVYVHHDVPAILDDDTVEQLLHVLTVRDLMRRAAR